MGRIKNRFQIVRKKFLSRHRGTVRTTFSLISVATLLSISPVINASSPEIRLQTDTTFIESGDRFSVDVYVNTNVAVNVADLTLTFQPDDVEVIGVDRSQSVLTIWTGEPIIETDKVILRGGTFRRGFIGEQKIATIDLRAKQTGRSQFVVGDVTLLAGDNNGLPVSVADTSDSDLSFYIYDKGADISDVKISTDVRNVKNTETVMSYLFE